MVFWKEIERGDGYRLYRLWHGFFVSCLFFWGNCMFVFVDIVEFKGFSLFYSRYL